MARPRKPVDIELLKKLAGIHCTMEEMASILNVSVDTLERRFADVIKECRDLGKMSLRRWQFQAAEKGNTGMMVWLGKQYLGQYDKAEERHTIDVKLVEAIKELEGKTEEELREILNKKS